MQPEKKTKDRNILTKRSTAPLLAKKAMQAQNCPPATSNERAGDSVVTYLKIMTWAFISELEPAKYIAIASKVVIATDQKQLLKQVL